MVVSCPDQFCLSHELVDHEFREPFITQGYRKTGIGFKNCLRSIFVPYCNESFNVWSHALFGIYFIVKYWKVFTEEFDITDPFVWPLLSFALGMVALCFMSASAHAFNAMSPYAFHKCFFLDYAGINIYGMGIHQAFFFYTRPLDGDFFLFNSSILFLSISLFNSVFGTYLCCITRTKMGGSLQHLVRAFVNTFTYLVTSTMIVYRMLFCTSDVDCDTTAMPLYWKHAVFLILSVFFYGSKIPERYCTGKFDCFGSSHNIFHILVCIGMDFKFEFIKSEIVNRKYRLQDDAIQPDLYSSLLLMALTIGLNLFICYFIEPMIKKVESNGKKND